MSQVLLETLVGAVEALKKNTKAMQEQINSLPDHTDNLNNLDGRLRATEAEVESLPGKILMPLPEIKALTNELHKHRQVLAMPLKQEVRHEHHLNKPILICVVLSLVVIGLLFLEYHTWLEADKHKENDMKYRYLKVFPPPQSQKFLNWLDSLYNSNPNDFGKAVTGQEAIKREQFEDFQRVQEKQEEIKGLQEKWNRQPESRSN